MIKGIKVKLRVFTQNKLNIDINMSKDCVARKCQDKISWVCLCADEVVFLCKSHLENHLNLPNSHDVTMIEESPVPETKNYLIQVLNANIDILKKYKKLWDNYKEKVENFLKDLNRQSFCIDEKIEQIEKLLLILEKGPDEKNLDTIVYQNFYYYSQIKYERAKLLFVEIENPTTQELELPKVQFELKNSFISMLEKIIKLPVKLNQKFLFEITGEFSDKYSKIKEIARSFKYYHGSMRDEAVTVKYYDYNPTIEHQIESQKYFYSQFPDNLLQIKAVLKKGVKIFIVTEKWSHTIWNECSTRKYENLFFNMNILFQFLKLFIEILENIDEILIINPNIIHILPDGQFKIWFPQYTYNIKGPFPYCSPEIASGNEVQDRKKSNLFSLGLVFLQLATLENTSKYYKQKHEEKRIKTLMTIEDKQLRGPLIGILQSDPIPRLNFEKVKNYINATMSSRRG